MSISSIGIDIVQIDRIKKACIRKGDRLLQRVFSPEERVDKYDYRKLAICFAAKEALFKALGIGLDDGIRWLDLSINVKDDYLLESTISGKAKDILGSRTVQMSIGSTGKIIVVTAVILN